MFRRSQIVWAEIRSKWLNLPNAICTETPPYLRNSSITAAIHLVSGALTLYADILKVPLLETTPGEVKLCLTKKRSATKEEIIAAMTKIYPNATWPVSRGKGCESTEMASHAADSLAVIESCLCDPVIIALRGLRK